MTLLLRNISKFGVLFALVGLLAPLGATAHAAELSPLHVDGRWLANEAGEHVVLRGCNLGGWFLIEPWMLGIYDQRVRDHHDFVTVLKERFGPVRAEELIDTFRANWITPRALELARSFGFNLVRVPFHYELLTDDAAPFELRADAFEWLDRAVALAQDAGMYAILDMHAAPGGQSVDMPSGRIGENELWASETHQRRMLWLWQRVAEHYRDNAAVVAYDLLNEPWGNLKNDERPAILKLVKRLLPAVREVDADKLIFLPGARHGILFYGDPAKLGWKNVGFTEHHYPGVFSGSSSLETHARYLSAVVPGRARLIEQLDVPYLLGEFNVVHDTAAQPLVMRKYYDACAEHGWLATMWSLRLINPAGSVAPNNWYMITNREPLRIPDLHSAADEEIEQAFRRLGEVPLVVDEPLRTALTAKQSPQIALASYPTLPATNVASELPAGWIAAEVGEVQASAVQRNGDELVIAGAGEDIWNDQDAFEFVCQQAHGDFEQRVVLSAFDATHANAKAGCMLRSSLQPDAAHVLIHAFPTGKLMMAWRAETGGQTQEQSLGISGFPVGLGIRRTAGQTHLLYTNADGQWQEVPAPAECTLTQNGVYGLVVGSHEALTPAFARFALVDSDTPLFMTRETSAANLLQNGSFEISATADENSDQARDWHRWGPWLNRETGWSPQRQGDCVLGYHHWQVEANETSGVYQDIAGLQTGSRYLFSVFANCDQAAAGKHGPQTVELRIESMLDGQIVQVASQDFNAADLATGSDWSRLQLAGTLPADNARVLIVMSPSKDQERGAAIKIDQAALRVLSGTG